MKMCMYVILIVILLEGGDTLNISVYEVLNVLPLS